MFIIESFDVVNDHDNSERLFTCAVCLGPISTPKILPKCGHSFCLTCLVAIQQNKAINKSKIVCPECRTISKLETDNLEEDLKTNVAVEKAMAGLCQVRTGKSGNDFDECPHILVFEADELTKCLHCKELFCEGCATRHAEMLRLEVNWLLCSMECSVGKGGKVVEELVCREGGNVNLLIEGFAEMRKLFTETSEVVTSLNADSLLYWKMRKIMARLRQTVANREGRALGFLLALTRDDDLEQAIAISSPKGANFEFEAIENRLHSRASEGDLTALREMFEAPNLPPSCKRYMLEHRDRYDRYFTILHQAAKSGHLETVSYLVSELGANVSAKLPEFSVLPIHLACSNGHLKVATYLLDKTPPECLGDESEAGTPLCVASFFGDLKMVKFLVEEKSLKIDKANAGVLPIHAAAMKGHLEIVKFLTEKGTNLRAMDAGGHIAIELATLGHHIDLVRYFLEIDPSLMVINNDAKKGYQLIHTAARYSLRVLTLLVDELKVDKLTQSKIGLLPLDYACRDGNFGAVRFLIEKGANPTVPGPGELRMLPIHSAAENGHLEIVSYLLELNPETLETKTLFRETPLSLAVYFNQTKVVDFLRSKGAKENVGMIGFFLESVPSDSDDEGNEEDNLLIVNDEQIPDL